MHIRINLSKILFYLLFTCITAAALAGMWGNSKVPPLFEAGMLFLACFYVRFIRHKFDSNSNQLNVIFIVVYCIIFIILTGYNSNVIPVSIFIATGSLMMIHIGILQKQFVCPTGMYVIIVISTFFFEAAFYFTNEVYYGTARTLAQWNPQSVGMWAYAFGASLFILADWTRNIKVKIFLYAHVAFMCYVSVITETRVVIGAFILLVATRMLPIIKISKYKWLAAIVAYMPAVVAILGAVSNINLFNGRERIWRIYLNLATESLLIGDYSKYHSVYTHNIFVDQVLCFGLLFSICFIALLGLLLYCSSKFVTSRCQYTAFIASVGMMLISSLEGAFFSGGSGGLFIYAIFCIYMMKSVDMKTPNLKKKIVVIG